MGLNVGDDDHGVKCEAISKCWGHCHGPIAVCESQIESGFMKRYALTGERRGKICSISGPMGIVAVVRQPIGNMSCGLNAGKPLHYEVALCANQHDAQSQVKDPLW